jgi:RNA-directed DNA polymerase
MASAAATTCLAASGFALAQVEAEEVEPLSAFVQVQSGCGDLRGWGGLRGGGRYPAGSPISPLLANIALHTLDEAWQTVGRRPGTLVRYADDLVVVCPTRERAEQARDLVAAVLATLGLHLP